MLVWIVSLLKGKYGCVPDPAVLLYSVCAGSKREDGLVIRGKARETQLGQIMDEEIELCGHTAQTGFNQPIRKKKVEEKRHFKVTLLRFYRYYLSCNTAVCECKRLKIKVHDKWSYRFHH